MKQRLSLLVIFMGILSSLQLSFAADWYTNDTFRPAGDTHQSLNDEEDQLNADRKFGFKDEDEYKVAKADIDRRRAQLGSKSSSQSFSTSSSSDTMSSQTQSPFGSSVDSKPSVTLNQDVAGNKSSFLGHHLDTVTQEQQRAADQSNQAQERSRALGSFFDRQFGMQDDLFRNNNNNNSTTNVPKTFDDIMNSLSSTDKSMLDSKLQDLKKTFPEYAQEGVDAGLFRNALQEDIQEMNIQSVSPDMESTLLEGLLKENKVGQGSASASNPFATNAAPQRTSFEQLESQMSQNSITSLSRSVEQEAANIPEIATNQADKHRFEHQVRADVEEYTHGFSKPQQEVIVDHFVTEAIDNKVQENFDKAKKLLFGTNKKAFEKIEKDISSIITNEKSNRSRIKANITEKIDTIVGLEATEKDNLVNGLMQQVDDEIAKQQAANTTDQTSDDMSDKDTAVSDRSASRSQGTEQKEPRKFDPQTTKKKFAEVMVKAYDRYVQDTSNNLRNVSPAEKRAITGMITDFRLVDELEQLVPSADRLPEDQKRIIQNFVNANLPELVKTLEQDPQLASLVDNEAVKDMLQKNNQRLSASQRRNIEQEITSSSKVLKWFQDNPARASMVIALIGGIVGFVVYEATKKPSKR
ncbi:MAG: hypothetical protein CL947_00350 [Epsilonproteobacteria bacterium]|nr:hypothetical protein [Campylobacterota bacterium]